MPYRLPYGLALIAVVLTGSAATAAPGFADAASMRAEVIPAKAKRGETVTYRFTLEPKKGYWTYPIKPGTGQASVSKFRLPETGNFIFVTEPKDPEAGWVTKPDELDPLKELKVSKGAITWEFRVVVSPKAVPGPTTIALSDRTFLEVCNDQGCIPSTGTPLPAIAFEILDGEPVPVEDQYRAAVDKALGPAIPAGNGTDRNLKPQPATHKGKDAKPASQVNRELETIRASLDANGTTAQRQSGLWGFLATAAVWGLVTLITPCVFPMIPITVSIFLKQSHNSTGRTLLLAGVYCLTIIVVLGLSAFFLLSTFVELSTDPWMNLSLCILFVVFALSLFGMYEVDLKKVFVLGFIAAVLVLRPRILAEFGAGPGNLYLTLGVGAVVAGYAWVQRSSREGSVLRFLQSKQSGGGVIGTIFGAVAFTIVGFTCVAPFLGGFAGMSASGNFSRGELLLGALAFSTAFAAPFFLLALFPSMIRKLPRSGGWLDSVKVVMGFLELAAAMKFLRTAELRWLPQPAYLTYDLVMAGWIAISFACALYLLNAYRLPHDEEKPNIGVPRLLFALLFLGLGMYLMPALFKGADGKAQRPGGAVFAWVDAFLLPEPSREADLHWDTDLNDTIKKVRDATKPGSPAKPIFVDFTGVTCTNCKYNEFQVFTLPNVRELLEQFERVQLYTDEVPASHYTTDPGDLWREDEARANASFQAAAFGSRQLPLYAILLPTPDGKVKLLGVYDEGKINQTDKFAAWLKEGLEKAKRGQ